MNADIVLCAGVMLLGVMCCVTAQDKPAATSADIAEIENVGRVEQDAKTGVYRVWIEIDKTHSVIAKFKQEPTETDIKAIREKTLAQEAEALAQAAAAKTATATAEALKAEGKCEKCGQALPKDGDK